MSVTSKYPSFNVTTGPVMPTGLDLQQLAAEASSHPLVAPEDGQVYGMQDGEWVVLDPSQGGVGPPGPMGPVGPTGPAGPQGPQGQTGQRGLTGDAGPAGPQGAAGADGQTGPEGVAGAQGPAGPTGANGAPGPEGPPGAAGVTGPAGPPGPNGPAGPTGAQGPQGDMGPSGSQGPQGADGVAGPPGQQGPQGNVGPAGATGPQGPTGPIGPQGPQGPSTVSTDAGNIAVLGSDQHVFVPAPNIPAAGNVVPGPDGTGSAGTQTSYSRSDHIHPSDPTRLQLAGGTMTGPLQLSGAPSTAMGAANKGYVDAAVPLASTANPVMNGTAAPGTGNTWARADHVHPNDTTRLAVAGGAMTGPLLLNADPTVPLGAVTKQYSDTKVPLAGGNMQGVLNLLGSVAADNAPAGCVGEVLFTSVTVGVNIPNTTPTNIATLALTAGDWDVSGVILFSPQNGPSAVIVGISNTSGALPSVANVLNGSASMYQMQSSGMQAGQTILQAGRCRVNTNASKSVFLVVQTTGAGTNAGMGYIWARRMR